MIFFQSQKGYSFMNDCYDLGYLHCSGDVEWCDEERLKVLCARGGGVVIMRGDGVDCCLADDCE